jgi:hypothetical protein
MEVLKIYQERVLTTEYLYSVMILHNMIIPNAVPLCVYVGWAFYSAVVGVGLTFVCAVLSVQAEVATSSDKVQYQIHQGRTLICLLWITVEAER